MSVRKLFSTKFNTEMQKRPSGSNNCFTFQDTFYAFYQVQGTRTISWTGQRSFFIVGHLFYKNLARLAAFSWESVDKTSLVWSMTFLACSNSVLACLFIFLLIFSWWIHHIFSVKGPLSWHTWLLDWNSADRELLLAPLYTPVPQKSFEETLLTTAFPLILSCSAFPPTD